MFRFDQIQYYNEPSDDVWYLRKVCGWLSEVLLKTPETFSDQQREYVGSIHEASRHMIDIVNDLLNVSRIELGTLQFHIEECDIKEIVQSVAW